MGWDNHPEYTPPNPPIWFWILIAAFTILAVVGLSTDLL